MVASVNYSVPKTGVGDIDGLLSGIEWATQTLTFSFPTQASQYEYTGEPDSGFQSLNAAQKAAVRAALTEIASFTNLNFQEITETASTHADLCFANSSEPSTAWAYYPSTAPQGGDAWFGTSNGYYTSPVKGDYAFASFLHEIGHALGLKHGHETDVYGPLPANHNSMEYSVMTYASYVGASLSTGFTNGYGSFAQSYMMDDIAALQTLYGADYTINASNTVYRWSPLSGEKFINGVGRGAPAENKIFETVWDGGGIDTYNFSNYATAVTVDLRPGMWSRVSGAQIADLSWDGSKPAIGNIANALLFQGDNRSMIENAYGGSGNDYLSGNAAKNLMGGGAGNDTLLGGGDIDQLYGGLGNDRLFGGAGIDTLGGGAGTDRFVFQTLADRGDRITDFASGTDRLEFAAAVFGNTFAKGALASAYFDVGSVATKAGPELFYNPTTKTLAYDPDGIGSKAAIALEMLYGVTSLKATDIWIV